MPDPEFVELLALRRRVEFVDAPLRDDAGKARRSAERAEVISRLQAQANR
jgi:hypothetical protein